MSDDLGYQGTQQPGDNQGDYNAQTFLAQSLINRVSSCTLVSIVAVTNAGGLSPVGFVDVQPLVNQLDGSRNAVPHGVVHNLPYFRLQGGTDAIIIDPKVGDIGIAVFASHDISSVKATKAQANPGSMRRFDMADGLYVGGVLNGVPTQYVRFDGTGVEIVSPNKITLTAPIVRINASGNVLVTSPTIGLAGDLAQTTGPGSGHSTMQGPLVVATEVTAATTPLHNHAHTGVTTGGGTSGGPVP